MRLCKPGEPANPWDDLPRGHLAGKKFLNKDNLDTMERVAKRMLGPRHLRTPKKPEMVVVPEGGQKLEGGIAFERGSRLPANSNQGARCYSTSLTVQAAKGNLVQPSVNLRDLHPDDPDLLKDFTSVRLFTYKFV